MCQQQLNLHIAVKESSVYIILCQSKNKAVFFDTKILRVVLSDL